MPRKVLIDAAARNYLARRMSGHIRPALITAEEWDGLEHARSAAVDILVLACLSDMLGGDLVNGMVAASRSYASELMPTSDTAGARP